MSNCVRWRSRCDSSSLPCSSSSLRCALELVADLADRALDRLLRRSRSGSPARPRRAASSASMLAGQRVELVQRLDLVAEQVDAVGGLGVGREDLERVAAHAEGAARERRVVARVLDVDQLAQDLVAVDRRRRSLNSCIIAVVLLRRAEAEDARDARDDDRVAAAEQRGGRRVAQPLDLLVDRASPSRCRGPARDVGLGLVVVVVRDEVLDRVVREELAELVAELRRQRLVVRDHQRRPLELLDRERHRGRLARARDAEQRLEAVARLDALPRARRAPPAGRRSACRSG